MNDDYFMALATTVGRASKDRSTKVGCVVIGPDNEVRSTGFNGFPRGINDNAPERHDRPEKYLWTEHAERNAIYNAARMGTALNHCRLFCTFAPCMDCARAIVQAGIREVIAPPIGGTLWNDVQDKAAILFNEANVKVRVYG